MVNSSPRVPWSGCENFVLKIPWAPPLKYFRNVVSRVPPPPKWKLSQRGEDIGFEYTPLPAWNLGPRGWDLGWIWVGLEPPSPRPIHPKLKSWPDWGTLDSSWSFPLQSGKRWCLVETNRYIPRIPFRFFVNVLSQKGSGANGVSTFTVGHTGFNISVRTQR